MSNARQLALIVFGVLALVTTRSAVSADTVATCKNPSGYGYYHHAGLLPKKSSGFEKEEITGGLTTLVRIGQKEYDVLFVDVRQTIISHRQDGGLVQLLRKGTNDATFLVIYPSKVIELYTFYRDAGGAERYDLLQSKGGDGMPIHKSAVMTGSCTGLNLNLLD